MPKVFIDTNILIYSIYGDARQKEKVNATLTGAGGQPVLSMQVLKEFTNVCLKKGCTKLLTNSQETFWKRLKPFSFLKSPFTHWRRQSASVSNTVSPFMTASLLPLHWSKAAQLYTAKIYSMGKQSNESWRLWTRLFRYLWHFQIRANHGKSKTHCVKLKMSDYSTVALKIDRGV